MSESSTASPGPGATGAPRPPSLAAPSLVPDKAFPEVSPPAAAAPSHRCPAHHLWATLLARLFASLPLVCPNCGADMRMVAFITAAAPVRRTLLALGEPAEPPRISPARGPPSRALGPLREAYRAPVHLGPRPRGVCHAHRRCYLACASGARAVGLPIPLIRLTSNPFSPHIQERIDEGVGINPAARDTRPGRNEAPIGLRSAAAYRAASTPAGVGGRGVRPGKPQALGTEA